ncbi:uncharacterized protein LOC135215073 isoform X2 [Macrobrachium nipponense]|uniref:uncharacterized protein LOC135215073 isoform X2 n=1 Tax=Macrobrachium nipponense TaxID=159736 RepID=UPI0030C7D9EA
MNLTEKQVIVVQALLWSISGGVLLILCLMIAITCILARKNLRTHHLCLSSSRQRKDEFGQSEEMVQHKKLQSTRSMDTDMYVAPRTDFSTKSTKSYDRSANRHGSPTNSLEHHIYDDPDYILSCAKMGRAHYGNESDISSSRESNNYEKVHDYANAGSLRH